MTREDMAALKVGDKIRKVHLHDSPLCHVIAIVADGNKDIAMARWWHKRWKCWRYLAIDADEMEILYEVAK